uniref:histone acetyltransferase HAC1 n=1 Tax=Erigeron canadensis TaxID=72917 RepID=UPI001CB98E38|nr:histone acetyltransferase HAC1 [Erigeron canadensis]XP_043608533.1 histone acetyltransferase HAC1 [Erigeron canadensis]
MMQNSNGLHYAEPDSIKARQFMQEKIYELLLQRQTGEMAPKDNLLDLIRRLEEGLYKSARTKEEYMNLETLEIRINLLIAHPNNQNLQYQQQNNANAATGTMIPTPGLPQSGNSNFMAPSSNSWLVFQHRNTINTLVDADGDNSMMPSAGNAVNYSMDNTGLSRGLDTGSFGSVNDHPSVPEHDQQDKLWKLLDLLVHASQCRAGECLYPDCRKMKGLFRHGMLCEVRMSGGCSLCKKMWHLIQRHTLSCKDTSCHVPRCRDLQKWFVMNMMSRCNLDENSDILRME